MARRVCRFVGCGPRGRCASVCRPTGAARSKRANELLAAHRDVVLAVRATPVLRIRATLAFFIFFTITVLLTPLVLQLSAPPFGLSHTEVGLFGLAGAAGALGASSAGRLADRGLGQCVTGIALALMLLSWLPIALLPFSLWGLILGIIIIDYGLQAVHVTNQSLIYRARPEAQTRLAAGYMIFYSIGCAVGSMLSTMTYARFGWSAVCLLGASGSAAGLLFWAATRARYHS